MYYIIALAFSALLCAIFGYIVFRGQGSSDSRFKMVIASFFSAPLLLGLLMLINIEIIGLLRTDVSMFSGYISTFLILMMIAVLSPIGWVHLVLTSTFIILAWFTKPEPRSQKLILGVYILVVLLYTGYNIWWYSSGQTMKLP